MSGWVGYAAMLVSASWELLDLRWCCRSRKFLGEGYLKCLIVCWKRFLDTNEKTNFTANLETARRII
uniref:Secreted protein n=1 Tax=Oryza brachyantha TaxID=4533 RepID=J3LSU7_ORYBR